MTPKKFFLYFLLQWIIWAVLKVWFFNYEVFSNQGVQEIVFWAAIIVATAAIVRRLGVISFLEAFFAFVVWSFGILLLDLLITTAYLGMGIFSSVPYWSTFIVFALAIFLFHKKRHLHIRKEMHHAKYAHQQGHAHGADATEKGHKQH
jgi:hypothetical protein